MSKIGRVVGLADSAPVDKVDPLSPINRLVMTHEVDETLQDMAQPQAPQQAQPPPKAPPH